MCPTSIEVLNDSNHMVMLLDRIEWCE